VRGGVLFKLMALRAPVDKTEVALPNAGFRTAATSLQSGRMPERGMTYVSIRETVEAAIRADRTAPSKARRGEVSPNHRAAPIAVWQSVSFKMCELHHTTQPRIDLPCKLLPSLGPVANGGLSFNHPHQNRNPES
jgi:hypothetical protein